MQQTTHDRLNVIIVDDEKDACNNLEHVLHTCAGSNIHIAGIARNTREAENLIQMHTPDAVFLDIEMPYENAFQFLDRISPVRFEVVFVTAYDAFAVRAFRLNAADYILKPVSVTEVKNTLDRLSDRKNIRHLLHGYNYHDLHDDIRNKKKADKITLKENNDVEVVAFRNICFVEANGSYSKIFFIKDGLVKTKTMSNNIAEYETLFPQELFYRVHKSYLVNCSYINRIFKNEQVHVLIKNEYTLPVSRRRYPDMLTFLKENDFHNE